MAECKECGKSMGFADRYAKSMMEMLADNALQTTWQIKRRLGGHQTKLRLQQKEAAINSIILTTETAPNLNITKRIEIVTAECAFGMNIFKDLFAGVRDIVGGRSEAVQKTMRDSRKTVLYELKKEAYEVGANAVVGVDLDYVELVQCWLYGDAGGSWNCCCD